MSEFSAETLSGEHWEQLHSQATNGVVTILFTDIQDSTRIKAALPGLEPERNQQWLEHFLQPHNDLIREKCAENNGKVVKLTGDGFMLAFSSPTLAIRCAVAIQDGLTAANFITPLEGNSPLKVRIGIHTGDVLQHENDYYGTAADKASRVMDAGHGGQIMLSEATRALTYREFPKYVFHSHGERLLKGIGAHLLYELLWNNKAPQEPRAAIPSAPNTDQPVRIALDNTWNPLKLNSWVSTLQDAAWAGIEPTRQAEARTKVSASWLQNIGFALFQWLLKNDELQQNYWQSSGPLFIELPPPGSTSLSLDNLPYELLHDGRDFVALTRGVVRVIGGQSHQRRLQAASGRLKLVAGFAAPVYDPEKPETAQPHVFDVEAQANIFRQIPTTTPVDIHFQRAGEDALADALSDEEPHVLHFVGHGSPRSMLLEDRYGAVHEVDCPTVRNWARESPQLRLTVLQSCSTATDGAWRGVAGAFLEGGVSQVLAMQFPVTVQGSKAFMQRFYERLTKGDSVYQALTKARKSLKSALGNERLWEWATPALFQTGDVTEPLVRGANGQRQLFDFPQRNFPPEWRPEATFVGRRAERVALAHYLDPQHNHAQRVVFMHAAGGIGKTELTRQVAWWVAPWFETVVFQSGRVSQPQNAVQHLPAGVSTTVVAGAEEFLYELGRKLGLESIGIVPADRLADILLQALNDGHSRLLILDNLDEIATAPQLLHFLRYIPTNIHVLATSRDDIPAFATKRAFSLDALSPLEAVDFACAYAPTTEFLPTAEEIVRIHRATGGNAFAMRLILGLVKENTALNRLLPDLPGAGIATEAMFDYLFSHALTVGGKDVTHLFLALGLFESPTIRDYLRQVAGFEKGPRFTNTAQRATELSLIETQDAEIYFMPPLARLQARRLLASAAKTNEIQKNFINFHLALAQHHQDIRVAQNRATLDFLWPNLYAATRIATEIKNPNLLFGLLDSFNDYFQIRSLWTERSTTYQWALMAARDMGNRRLEGASFNNLGNVYRSQGKWNEAENAFRESLTIFQEMGDKHREGQTLHNLGNVYRSQGKWNEAKNTFLKSLTIFQDMGDKHSEGACLNSLGNAYRSQGNWAEAENYYQQSLTIRREMGDRHGEGLSLGSLGTLHQAQGNWAEAENYYQQSLTIKREMGDRYGEGVLLGNLGTIYMSQGKWVEAEKAYAQDLKISQDLGDRHGEGQTLNNLGNIYRSLGKWVEAAKCYQQSLTIKKEIGDNYGEGITLSNLALLWLAQDKYAEALTSAKQAVATLEKTEAQSDLEKAQQILAALAAELNDDSTSPTEEA